jgi:hypothetical protein
VSDTAVRALYFGFGRRGEHFEDLDVDGRIILNWSNRNRVRICGLDSSGSG